MLPPICGAIICITPPKTIEPPAIKAADEKAKKVFDDYANQRRRLKEAEGAKENIAALRAMLKDEHKG